MKNVMNMIKKKEVLLNSEGITAIEFAILFPIFLIMALGVIEFGMYFVKFEMVNNSVNQASMALERDPQYFSNMTPSQLSATVKAYSYGLLNLSAPNTSTTGNFICVDAYSTAAAAQSAPVCTSTHFNTTNPAGAGSKTPYYVAVRSELQKATLTPLGNFIPKLKNIKISESSGVIEIGDLIPPVCNGAGQGLQFDGTKYICVDIYPPNCSHPWQRLEYNNGWQCINVPYVMAGGTAWPSTANGGVWQGDYSWREGGAWHNDFTICKNNVTFTVPTGLPAGQIIARGNLIYPVGCSTSCSGNGSWHAWSVSFQHLKVPMGGGTASMNVCMGNGGNYWNNGYQPGIFSEHVSWTAIYIPNNAR